MFIVKFLLIIILAFLIPILLGSGGSSLFKLGKNNFTVCIILGLFWEWAIFSLVCIPLIYIDASFTKLVIIYSVALFCLCVLALIKSRNRFKEMIDNIFSYWKNNTILIYIILAVLIVICVVEIFYMHSDADDSEYVAMATSAIQQNSLMRYDALTGLLSSATMLKRIIAPFSLWCAYFSKIIHIHPAIFCHTIMPVMMVIYSFFLYQYMADVFYNGNSKKRNTFLAVLYLILLFGGYSTFTMAERLLLRGWQGKSVLATLGIPLVFILMFQYMQKKLSVRELIGIMAVVLGCTATSSMANVLLIILINSMLVCQFIKKRNILEAVKWELVCAPCYVFALLYVLG